MNQRGEQSKRSNTTRQLTGEALPEARRPRQFRVREYLRLPARRRSDLLREERRQFAAQMEGAGQDLFQGTGELRVQRADPALLDIAKEQVASSSHAGEPIHRWRKHRRAAYQ